MKWGFFMFLFTILKNIIKFILPNFFYLKIRFFIIFCSNYLFFTIASCYMWFLNLKEHTMITFINSERIGHFVMHIDLFFRIKKSQNMREKNIFLITLPVCNEFLLHKWGEIGVVVDYRKKPIFAYMLKSLFLFHSRYIREMPCDDNEYEIYRQVESVFAFSEQEKILGEKILQEHGIGSQDWFVCIFARDNAYMRTVHGGTAVAGNAIRNTNIENLVPSIEYIIQAGGWVIRLGNIAEKRLNYGHPHFIDYPFEDWKSDFMDLYLQYRAKFILSSSTSGATDIASLFDTPYCGVNMPFYYNSKYKNAIHQPVKLCRDNVLIGLEEWIGVVNKCEVRRDFFSFQSSDFFLADFYKKNGIHIVENTPEEILDLVKEMFERLEGRFVQTDEDKRLQEKYLEIYKNYSFFAENKNPIGRDFLRKNAEWFLREE